uniref:Phosphoribosyltransferase domain-containing protein n=1 Tax=Antithamnionella ternifolia TaxID=207919 RepID=A0A4D6WL90_9FLOR|nr:hypothetical protein [Antithamnionella ternifolia]
MKLNIFLLSHPLIKIFTKYIQSNQYSEINQNITKSTYKYLGNFLMYEVLRKFLIIQNLYINKLDHVKEISILDYQQKNYILSDIIANFEMLTEIEQIIPQIQLKHINLSQTNTWQKINLQNINNKTNIIILDKFIKNDNIVKLIEYLNKVENINTKYITLACITCTNKILEKISLEYTDLNIYTTHIIDY